MTEMKTSAMCFIKARRRIEDKGWKLRRMYQKKDIVKQT